MSLHWCWLYILILVKSGAAASGDSCDNDAAPTYVSLECVIFGENVISRIRDSDSPGGCINDYKNVHSNCVVYAGQELHVT